MLFILCMCYVYYVCMYDMIIILITIIVTITTITITLIIMNNKQTCTCIYTYTWKYTCKYTYIYIYLYICTDAFSTIGAQSRANGNINVKRRQGGKLGDFSGSGGQYMEGTGSSIMNKLRKTQKKKQSAFQTGPM